MYKEKIKELLRNFKEGEITEEEFIENLKYLPYKDINLAKIDTHRSLKFNFPEVVFGQNKTYLQIKRIISELKKVYSNLIVTKVDEKIAKKIKKDFPEIIYFKDAKILAFKKEKEKNTGYVCVITGGTADIPVAEEASITLEIIGVKVKRIYDAGVAGLHRLLDKIEIINKAKCLIVVAGMEGALPSVVGGLVEKPVIAVPTSIGYGVNLNGIAPLLSMLNSCSPNVVVVNINNGFGAAFFSYISFFLNK
ncbi:MAG: nickel pincer cofactor biosynthesis protein LarB [Candidatus Omnitrophica bacterium]|nr:nickel pincer cofactor biosynthesis protein LarB [Candidatus Omnitrophota bacterium]MCM8802790.1 nickel pincer cofactor biosynthesis protein LarB [Candidatus Omnitrophota bacterium]